MAADVLGFGFCGLRSGTRCGGAGRRRAGRWGRLAREVRGRSWAGAAHDVWEYGVKDVIRGRQPAALRAARRGPPPALLHPALVRETQFGERLAALDPPLPSSRHRLAALVHHPPSHRGLEQLAWTAETMGLTIATPYWDRSLVELCMGVPRDHLLRDGAERVLLREAMAGRLPESVRTRRSKATFNPLLNLTLRAHAADDIAAMLDAPGPLAEWCDLAVLRTLTRRWAAAPAADLRAGGSGDAQALLRTVTIWHWARRLGL